MDIGLLSILRTVEWDFRRDMIQGYANVLNNAMTLHLGNDIEKQHGFFLSKKGCQSARGNFEDKLYVGNIHRIENHLYWKDEELADDDQIINVVVVNGPVTRDGGACSYGTKDFRDQVEYANTIPQVIGHVFIVNTPGGETACRNDYAEMFDNCRTNNKPTVWYVDGMCCSSGVNAGCRADRIIVRNPKDAFGCIGSMAAFWHTPDGAIDSRDGSRFVEIVGEASPDKNAEFRHAAEGDYEELRKQVNKSNLEFHDTVRQNRPLVEDWMLTGKVFEAQELIPALVDEIGDLNRAIECVFELAEGKLEPARNAKPVVVPEPPKEPETPTEEPTETPEEKTNTQTPNDMTQEEIKAAEVAEQPVAAQEAETTEAPVNTEAPAEGAAAPEAPANDETAENAEGAEAPAEEPASEETPEAPAEEEQTAESAEDAEKPAEEQASEDASEAPATEQPAPASEETPAEEQPSEEAVAQAAEDIDKITETLHNAEALVEQRDKEIAELRETLDATAKEFAQTTDALTAANEKLADSEKALAARDKSIEEKDALIEQLKKQNADLRTEVKELAAQPTPMTNADSGIPADNGTGEAPKDKNQPRVRRDMSYKEIREAMKKGKK